MHCPSEPALTTTTTTTTTLRSHFGSSRRESPDFRRLGFCLIATSLMGEHFIVLLSGTLCACSGMPIEYGMPKFEELLVPPSALQPSSSPGFLDGVVSVSKGNVALLDAPPSALAGKTVFDGLDIIFQLGFCVHSAGRTFRARYPSVSRVCHHWFWVVLPVSLRCAALLCCLLRLAMPSPWFPGCCGFARFVFSPLPHC